jgi:hypothetical protein
MFSQDPTTDKYLLVVTDCQEGGQGIAQLQQLCHQLDQDHKIGVGYMGFGAMQNVVAIGGGKRLAQPVTNFLDAAKNLAELFARTRVHNDGTARGSIASVASGVGVSLEQQPLSVAPASVEVDPMAEAVTRHIREGRGPSEVYVANSPRRHFENPLDARRLTETTTALKADWAAAERTPTFGKCKALVDGWDRLAASQGWVQKLAERLHPIIPQGGEVEWQRQVEQGIDIDPEAIPLLVKGLETGRPPPNFMMNPRESQTADLKVIISYDFSPSTEGQQRYKMLQAGWLIGDALKAVDSSIQIAQTGWGSRPTLISAFDQDWQRAKAHCMHRGNVLATRGVHKASDDERGIVEDIAMLKLSGARHGLIIHIGDGQGMGGTKEYDKEANDAGYAVLHVGPGPFCTAVIPNFGTDHSLAVANIEDIAASFPETVRAQQDKYGLA